MARHIHGRPCPACRPRARTWLEIKARRVRRRRAAMLTAFLVALAAIVGAFLVRGAH